MPSRLWRLRLAALLGAGSFAVHQLRFLLAFGGHAGERLAVEGHAYLAPAAPLAMWLLLALFVQLLAGAAPAQLAPAVRLRRLWLGSSAALLIVYCAQELLEGMLVNGHPGGLSAIASGGGWLALPLALAIGFVVALLARGAACVAGSVTARRLWRTPSLSPLPAPLHASRVLIAAAAPRATHLARGPPAVSV